MLLFASLKVYYKKVCLILYSLSLPAVLCNFFFFSSTRHTAFLTDRNQSPISFHVSIVHHQNVCIYRSATAPQHQPWASTNDPIEIDSLTSLNSYLLMYICWILLWNFLFFSYYYYFAHFICYVSLLFFYAIENSSTP